MVRSGYEALSWIGNRGLEELDLFDTYHYQGRTPLHIAAERGDREGVINILSTRPELATEVDFNGSSPLHLASANGHLQIVRHLLLLDVNQDTCLLQDNNGNTPLHLAAKRGKTAVVNHLLDVNQDAYLLRDNNGNTPLHGAANSRQIEVATLLIGQLQQQPGKFIGEIESTSNLQNCVIRCGPEALEQIIQADPNFLNDFDDKGNTLLHTAALLNNLEMVRYLVRRDDMWIAKNKKSLTALDTVKISSKGPDVNNDTKEILTLLKRNTDEWEHKLVNFEKKWNAIQVAASVIAFLTFQAGLNPPRGVFQEDKRNPNGDLISPMGTSVIAFTNPYRYVTFLIVNTLAFVSSMCIVVLLISRIHLKLTVYMWLVTVGMWSTITAMEYFDTVQFTTPMKVPRFDKKLLILLLCKPFSVCLGLTTTLLLLRTDPYTKFFKKIVSYAYGMLRNNACSEVFQKPMRLENQDDNGDDADQHDKKKV